VPGPARRVCHATTCAYHTARTHARAPAEARQPCNVQPANDPSPIDPRVTYNKTAHSIVASTFYNKTATSRCYLPPGRGEIPAFAPAEAGTRLSDPGGMQGRVDLRWRCCSARLQLVRGAGARSCRSISPARARQGARQQTRRPPLLPSIDRRQADRSGAAIHQGTPGKMTLGLHCSTG